jgi:hypothetical protein
LAESWQKTAADDGSVAENFFPSAKFLVSKRIYFFVAYCNARASRRKPIKPADFACAAGFSRRFLHSLNRTAQRVALCDWRLKGIRASAVKLFFGKCDCGCATFRP